MTPSHWTVLKCRHQVEKCKKVYGVRFEEDNMPWRHIRLTKTCWFFGKIFSTNIKTKRLVVGCGFCTFGDPLNLQLVRIVQSRTHSKPFMSHSHASASCTPLSFKAKIYLKFRRSPLHPLISSTFFVKFFPTHWIGSFPGHGIPLGLFHHWLHN